ncbi:MAG TPA: hypothetical protein VIM42_03985 [Clostridium sp.]
MADKNIVSGIHTLDDVNETRDYLDVFDFIIETSYQSLKDHSKNTMVLSHLLTHFYMARAICSLLRYLNIFPNN